MSNDVDAVAGLDARQAPTPKPEVALHVPFRLTRKVAFFDPLLPEALWHRHDDIAHNSAPCLCLQRPVTVGPEGVGKSHQWTHAGVVMLATTRRRACDP